MTFSAIDILREIVRANNDAPGFGMLDQRDNDGDWYQSADLANWMLLAQKMISAAPNTDMVRAAVIEIPEGVTPALLENPSAKTLADMLRLGAEHQKPRAKDWERNNYDADAAFIVAAIKFALAARPSPDQPHDGDRG